jgi:hypothetical protein
MLLKKHIVNKQAATEQGRQKTTASLPALLFSGQEMMYAIIDHLVILDSVTNLC